MTIPIKHFVRNGSGATATEYALLAAVIALAVVAGADMIGAGVNGEVAKADAAISQSMRKEAASLPLDSARAARRHGASPAPVLSELRLREPVAGASR